MPKLIIGLFLFLSVSSLAQTQKQSKELADVYIRLVLCDLDGEHPDNLPIEEKLETVSRLAFWRMQLFQGNPEEVSASYGVYAKGVQDASGRVEHFLADQLLPLLWGRNRWPSEPKALLEHMSQKLGISVSNIEASNMLRFTEQGKIPASRDEFVKLIAQPLKRWRSQLLWVQRHTVWELKSFPQIFDIEELTGEFSVVEWGEKLPVELGSYRMGFKSAFTLARSADGEIVVVWAPTVYNTTKISNPVYVEIVELGEKRNLFSHQGKVTGPYVASFDKVKIDELRTMTLRFSNLQQRAIEEMTVMVDVLTGQVVTYEGKEGGENLRLDLLLKKELSNSKSELNEWLLDQKPELRTTALFERDVDAVIKDLEFNRMGEIDIVLQKFREGTWDLGSECRVRLDRVLSREFLKRASRVMKP